MAPLRRLFDDNDIDTPEADALKAQVRDILLPFVIRCANDNISLIDVLLIMTESATDVVVGTIDDRNYTRRHEAERRMRLGQGGEMVDLLVEEDDPNELPPEPLAPPVPNWDPPVEGLIHD